MRTYKYLVIEYDKEGQRLNQSSADDDFIYGIVKNNLSPGDTAVFYERISTYTKPEYPYPDPPAKKPYFVHSYPGLGGVDIIAEPGDWMEKVWQVGSLEASTTKADHYYLAFDKRFNIEDAIAFVNVVMEVWSDSL